MYFLISINVLALEQNSFYEDKTGEYLHLEKTLQGDTGLYHQHYNINLMEQSKKTKH